MVCGSTVQRCAGLVWLMFVQEGPGLFFQSTKKILVLGEAFWETASKHGKKIKKTCSSKRDRQLRFASETWYTAA